MLRIIRAIIRHPKVTAVCLLLSMAVASAGAAQIRFRFQFSDFFAHETNPEMPAFRSYLNSFGEGASVLLLISAQDVFAHDTLAYVDRLTRSLDERPEYKRVRSLTNIAVPRATEQGIETGPLVSQLPQTKEEVESLRKAAFNSSLLPRRLVSLDSTVTAIVLNLPITGELTTLDNEEAALNAAQQALDTIPRPPGVTAIASGAALVEVDTTNTIIRDQLVLTPALLVLLALALLATFRSVQGLIIPLAVVNVAVIWTVGLFGFTVKNAGLMASIIPTVLLSYGVVDPIFVLARYYKHIANGLDRESALINAFEQMLLPCFLTSLSTSLGFVAFASAPLPMLRDFGIIVGLGVLLAFVTTVLVLPVLITLLPTPKHAKTFGDAPPLVDAAMRALFRVTRGHRALVLGCAVAVIGLGVIAYQHTVVNNVFVGVLPDGPTVRGVALADAKLSGVMTHAVLLEGPADSMKKPEVLTAIAAIDDYAEKSPLVGSATSVTDLVRDIHRAFNDGDPELAPLPTSASLTSQYFTMVDPKDLGEFVNDDFSQSHITVRASDPGSRQGLRLDEDLKHFIAAQHLERYGVRSTLTVAGTMYRELDRLVDEILFSFLLAFSIIVVVQWFFFRSLRIALSSILPNLMPVAAGFLTLRGLGLDLRMDNAIVLCVCVGGLFNTTIHLVTRMLQQMREGETNPDVLIENSLRTVGPPSLFTSVVLSLGFSVLLLSKFPGMRVFGLLCSVTLISGFLSDALVTSVIMRWLVNVGARLSRYRPHSERTNTFESREEQV